MEVVGSSWVEKINMLGMMECIWSLDNFACLIF